MMDVWCYFESPATEESDFGRLAKYLSFLHFGRKALDSCGNLALLRESKSVHYFWWWN